VSCPVCHQSAPVAERFEQAYPGRISGVGQDPPERLRDFATEWGVTFPSVPEQPPYPVSNAYGIRVVPTLFLVAPDGEILETVESWDREGYNAVSRRLSDLIGATFEVVSTPGDALPPFRPG
jgi:hypothetical protein